MSEILQGVLRMPIECWSDDPLDQQQRRDCYIEAADRIDELEDAMERSGVNGLKRRIEALEKGLAEAMEWNWLTDPQDINPDVVERLTALLPLPPKPNGEEK